MLGIRLPLGVGIRFPFFCWDPPVLLGIRLPLGVGIRFTLFAGDPLPLVVGIHFPFFAGDTVVIKRGDPLLGIQLLLGVRIHLLGIHFWGSTWGSDSVLTL